MSAPLIERVRAAFRAAYGTEPDALIQAPGRVNLIGEHTDYNDGFVLPCAIDFRTVIALRGRTDHTVRVVAADYPGQADRFHLDEPILAHPGQTWSNYVRGTVMYLQEHLDDRAGAAARTALRGLDMAIGGDVPQGAGLSSSASLEVAVGQAFKTHQGLEAVTPTDLALVAQRAENRFVGCNCGIMDQLISASGEPGHALLLDCRSLEARQVLLPPGVAVLIAHSHVQRGLVDSEYNTRRQQCEAAAQHYGVAALRDVDVARLEAGRAGLDATVLRRARHIVTENQRTLDAAEALAAGDLARMGELMAASHASMRDDFEITHPSVDHLVTILQQAIGGVGGARMTGGGFGGCVVALLPEDRVEAARAAVAAQYRSPDGAAATVWVCHASAGAGQLA